MTFNLDPTQKFRLILCMLILKYLKIYGHRNAIFGRMGRQLRPMVEAILIFPAAETLWLRGGGGEQLYAHLVMVAN